MSDPLVERATAAIQNTACSCPDVDGAAAVMCCACDARAAVDAAMPLIATVSDLEALPAGAKLVEPVSGRIWWSTWRRSDGPQWWRNDTDGYDRTSESVIAAFGSLRVVWTP